MKYFVIDERMRKVEKEKISQLGKIIEVKKNKNTYTEISSHTDIFICKVGDKLIVEPSQYDNFKKIKNVKKGFETIGEMYPLDIKYNVCIIGNKAIHNFKYTDIALKEELLKNNYEMINTTQGYTNCSIAVIDENSAIVTDKGLYKILEKNNIEVLYIKEELDIKLLSEKCYSNKKGFIGGVISRVGNNIFVTGDLNKIDKEQKIRQFILKRGIEIIEFENIDVIDYGGIIEIDDDQS